MRAPRPRRVSTHDIKAKTLELLDRFRRRRDARFAGAALLEDCEFHGGRDLAWVRKMARKHDEQDADR